MCEGSPIIISVHIYGGVFDVVVRHESEEDAVEQAKFSLGENAVRDGTDEAESIVPYQSVYIVELGSPGNAQIFLEAWHTPDK